MEYVYEPQGVCSYEMKIEVEKETIKKVTIEGGCAGNTLGVSRLVEGMNIDEAIKRLKEILKIPVIGNGVGVSKLVEGMKIEEAIKKLKGIQCGLKGTSCPDQLAKALENIKEKM